mmetsp:Transcript_4020/g.7169  ORF Transcript_4020/g.7169 Transcript_4020/m.7169 type:complete len:94 (-) Transcript_4020:311-592(-)
MPFMSRTHLGVFAAVSLTLVDGMVDDEVVFVEDDGTTTQQHLYHLRLPQIDRIHRLTATAVGGGVLFLSAHIPTPAPTVAAAVQIDSIINLPD